MGLVSIGDVKTFMGLTDSCDTGKITKLIAYVSAGVESYLGRTIAATVYREWYDGSGTSVLRTEGWPVTRLYQVSDECQNLGRLTYTGTSVEAFASSDGAVLTLVDSDAHDLTLSTYPTGTTLKDAVDALTGWTLTLYTSEAASLDTRKLRPFHEAANSGSSIDLELPEDAIDSRISNRSEWLIEGGFPEGLSNIFVWYKAGYAETPEDLKFTVLQIIRDVWYSTESGRDLTKESEKLGDYAYKNASGTAGEGGGVDLTHIVASYGEQLSAYRRVEWA